MGQMDCCSKKFLGQAEVFADACNTFLFEGDEVVHADELSERSIEKICHSPNKKRKDRLRRAERDLLKQVVCKTDGAASFLLVGIESQTELDYCMVLRSAFYDVLEYMNQVEVLAMKRRRQLKAGELKGDPNYVSVLPPGTKLIPVITLVIYMNPKPWEGARSLHEMLDIGSPELAQYIFDYHLNIIEPCYMKDADFARLKSDLGPILKSLQLAGKKEELYKYLVDNSVFDKLGDESIQMMRRIVGDKLVDKIQKKEGDSMTRDFQTLSEYLLEKGQKQGEEQGRKIGEEQGWKKGEEQGWKKGEEHGRKIGEEHGRKIGEEHGRKIGEEQGVIIGTIRTCLEFRMPESDIIMKLMVQLGLSEGEAHRFMTETKAKNVAHAL